MTDKCPYYCGNKNSQGYCQTTVCINPMYNGSGTFYYKDNIPNSCRYCSNHPSNGGSGICHCTLGGITWT